MRYNQIINEVLDMSFYGSWLNSKTGKSYPVVHTMGHLQWLSDNLHTISEFQPFVKDLEERLKQLTPDEIDCYEDGNLFYDMAYKAGFIKAVHPTSDSNFSIVLGGTKKDLAQSMKYVWSDLRHSVGKLYLYVYNGLDTQANEMNFKLPHDLPTVRNYINS